MTKKWEKELVIYRIRKGRETLEDARVLAEAHRWNTCVNRLYYACFYSVVEYIAGMVEGSGE